MIRRNYVLSGILTGVILAAGFKPVLSETILTFMYEKEIQEKLETVLPDIEGETSLKVKYYKRYLAYGDIVIGKEKYFFMLNPDDVSPYDSIKIFMEREEPDL